MLDDLLDTLKHGNPNRRGYGHAGRHGDHDHGHHPGHGHHAPMVLATLRAILSNKILLAALFGAFLVVAALGAWLLVTLLSRSGPLLDSLARGGVKGLLETALSLLRALWEGTGGK